MLGIALVLLGAAIFFGVSAMYDVQHATSIRYACVRLAALACAWVMFWIGLCNREEAPVVRAATVVAGTAFTYAAIA